MRKERDLRISRVSDHKTSPLPRSTRAILNQFASGTITLDEAEDLLRSTAVQKIGDIANLDPGREIRNGIPEIILAEGKDLPDLLEIVKEGLAVSHRILVSRLVNNQLRALRTAFARRYRFEEAKNGRIVSIQDKNISISYSAGRIGILTAGTSDRSVAEETKYVANAMGCRVFAAYDVGIAGIHRLFTPLRKMILEDVDVLVVIAGREGALPSVIAGLVDLPIIAVPTSVGYGYGEKGIAALMAMLQSCSLGLSVVNIDNGVGAGAIAALIARKAHRRRRRSNRNPHVHKEIAVDQISA